MLPLASDVHRPDVESHFGCVSFMETFLVVIDAKAELPVAKIRSLFILHTCFVHLFCITCLATLVLLHSAFLLALDQFWMTSFEIT